METKSASGSKPKYFRSFRAGFSSRNVENAATTNSSEKQIHRFPTPNEPKPGSLEKINEWRRQLDLILSKANTILRNSWWDTRILKTMTIRLCFRRDWKLLLELHNSEFLK